MASGMSTDKPQDKKSLFGRATFLDDKFSLFWGLGVVVGTLATGYAIKSLIYSEADSLELISAVKSSALYLGGGFTTGSITVIALMLNALGTARNLEAEFDKDVFLKIYRITIYAALMLASSVLLLLTLCLPLKEIKGIPEFWYTAYYYFTLSLVALSAGLMITTMFQFLEAIHHIIGRVLKRV